MQEQAVHPLNASLDKQNDILYKIAILLTGQKICDAAALAASAGNVRLATIIIQVSVLSHAMCVIMAKTFHGKLQSHYFCLSPIISSGIKHCLLLKLMGSC